MNILTLLEQLAFTPCFKDSANILLKKRPSDLASIILTNNAEAIKNIISDEYLPNESHVLTIHNGKDASSQ